MQCPNCGNEMSYVNLDAQHILHCPNCGSSFFEENGINRLSINSAIKLKNDMRSEYVSGGIKVCPKDNNPLSPLSSNDTVFQDITLLQCKSCKGIFTYSDDLLRFKKTQIYAVNSFAQKNKPIPALRTVLVFSFLAVISFAVISRFDTFIKMTSQQSQASDVIKKVTFTRSGRYYFMYFSTKERFEALITIIDQNEHTTIQKIIIPTQISSDSYAYQLTITDLNPDHTLFYRIDLTDANKNTINIKFQKIILQ